MNSIIELENEIEIKECPYCKSNHFIKYGKFNGIQRYKCKNKECGKTFNNNKNNPFRYSKKFKDKWKEYFDLDIEKGCLSNMHIDKAIIVTYKLCKKLFQK